MATLHTIEVHDVQVMELTSEQNEDATELEAGDLAGDDPTACRTPRPAPRVGQARGVPPCPRGMRHHDPAIGRLAATPNVKWQIID